MTNQQILEKAIQKTIDGGWKQDYKVKFTFLNDDGSRRITAKHTVDDWDTYAPIIFNHDFAKALWGEEDCPYDIFSNRKYSSGTGGPDEDWYEGALWEFHLQQMVVAEDPIKYLRENI